MVVESCNHLAELRTCLSCLLHAFDHQFHGGRALGFFGLESDILYQGLAFLEYPNCLRHWE
jgi:hypothetical protein